MASRISLAAIETVTAQLHESNPLAFHTAHTMALRFFLHRPRHIIPMAGYVYLARRQECDGIAIPLPAPHPKSASDDGQ